MNSKIVVNKSKATISSIKRDDAELIAKDAPLFSVKLRRKDATSFVITSKDFAFVKEEDGATTYSHELLDAEVILMPMDGEIHGRINVHNKSGLVIEWVEFLSFSVDENFVDDGGSGEILFPYNEGCVVSSLTRRENAPFRYYEPDYPSQGRYCIFPNMICSQFISYLKGDFGVILYAQDESRGTKHIDFVRDNGGCRVFIRTYTGCRYGESYKMPFDMVIKTFEGNFYDACEIYRQWFEAHKVEGLTKIKDNESLPKWYHNSPIILAFPLRGHNDTGEMEPNGFFPYQNTIKICSKLSKKLESPVMELLMQWESGSPWAPPFYWPPLGGEAAFSKFLKESHELGMSVGLYCSGLGWTEYSKIVPEYNKQKIFQENHYRDIVCENSNGNAVSTIVAGIRFGYDLCPYNEEARKLFSDNINVLASSGVDYVQALDQNHGGNAYFCYSPNHGHPDVPGPWQVESTLKAILMLDESKVLYGCESASAEPFLAKLLFSDNRFNLNYYIGKPFPVHSYIYHEYLNNFMGNQICMTLEKTDYNFSYRVAYSFTAGDMLTTVLSDKGNIPYSWCDDETTDKDNALMILSNLNKWRRGIGADYLHMGKMVKPIKVESEGKSFKCEDSTILHVDGVQTQAFEYRGKVMQFIVNYQNQPINVVFPKAYMVYESPDKDIAYLSKEMDIAPNSAIMVRLK